MARILLHQFCCLPMNARQHKPCFTRYHFSWFRMIQNQFLWTTSFSKKYWSRLMQIVIVLMEQSPLVDAHSLFFCHHSNSTSYIIFRNVRHSKFYRIFPKLSSSSWRWNAPRGEGGCQLVTISCKRGKQCQFKNLFSE